MSLKDKPFQPLASSDSILSTLWPILFCHSGKYWRNNSLYEGETQQWYTYFNVK